MWSWNNREWWLVVQQNSTGAGPALAWRQKVLTLANCVRVAFNQFLLNSFVLLPMQPLRFFCSYCFSIPRPMCLTTIQCIGVDCIERFERIDSNDCNKRNERAAQKHCWRTPRLHADFMKWEVTKKKTHAPKRCANKKKRKCEYCKKSCRFSLLQHVTFAANKMLRNRLCQWKLYKININYTRDLFHILYILYVIFFL